ncbi:transcriptional regulator [Amycolatopsis echigonensis]|uniref:transcriptional regulator n=1 Tax=Amycolatopsis echigonensis TaxID=2576905 RepID=UPI000C7046D6|nr:helix-turn-helix transcriptional regulator [Amycolatopsis niigatensis]
MTLEPIPASAVGTPTPDAAAQPPETAGALVRRRRQASGLSINRLAVRSGISASTIGTLERGRTPLQSLWTAAALAYALKADPYALAIAAGRSYPAATRSDRDRGHRTVRASDIAGPHRTLTYFGEMLYLWRIRHNRTLTQVAELTGADRLWLSRVERMAAAPSIPTVVKIADGLNLSRTELLVLAMRDQHCRNLYARENMVYAPHVRDLYARSG